MLVFIGDDRSCTSEAKTAVKIAQGAGLKSVMVTGDYKDTAEAIARESVAYT